MKDATENNMAETYIIVYITLIVILSIAGIFGNGVMIISFILRRNLRTIQNWFNLATFVSGFIMSLITFPLQVYIDIVLFVQNPHCAAMILFQISSSMFFTLSVLALTIERYISICHPLHAPTILTAKRAGMGIGIIISYPFILGYLIPIATPLVNKGPFEPGHECRLAAVVPRFYVIIVAFTAIIPILAIFLLYCRIFIVLRRHIRAVVAQVPRINLYDNNPVATENRERQRWNREMKSALFLLVLILSFGVPWMTVTILSADINFRIQVTPFVFIMTHALLFTSVALNPYLYGLGNKLFRRAVVSVFCKRCLSPNEHDLTSNSTSVRVIT